MANTEERLCWECIGDKTLCQWIRKEGRRAKCSFCNRQRITCTIHQVAEKIDNVIRIFYRPGDYSPYFDSESDNPYYEQGGESAAYVIQEIAGVEEEIADAIVDHLGDEEARAVHDGEDALYDGTPLEHIQTFPDEFMYLWMEFEERFRHKTRFFDDEGKRRLDALFGDLPDLSDGKAIVVIEPNSESATIYRARLARNDSEAEVFMRDPARHVGPPPRQLARAGRMNPVGIPAFYGAFSAEVAIAEVRPPVGAKVAVGRFSLLRPIRLLDLTFFPFAYHQESIFSPIYDEIRNKLAFLEGFQNRISRPVLPEDEALAYLPTQAFAAYLANVMKLDGVIYASTQIGADLNTDEQVDRRLCNVALFADAARVEESPRKVLKARDATVRDLAPLATEFEYLISPTPAQAENKTIDATQPVAEENPVMEPPPTQEEGAPTLRVDPQLEFIKIRAVKVESSSVFAHLYDNGEVIIDDHDDE